MGRQALVRKSAYDTFVQAIIIPVSVLAILGTIGFFILVTKQSTSVDTINDIDPVDTNFNIDAGPGINVLQGVGKIDIQLAPTTSQAPTTQAPTTQTPTSALLIGPFAGPGITIGVNSTISHTLTVQNELARNDPLSPSINMLSIVSSSMSNTWDVQNLMIPFSDDGQGHNSGNWVVPTGIAEYQVNMWCQLLHSPPLQSNITVIKHIGLAVQNSLGTNPFTAGLLFGSVMSTHIVSSNPMALYPTLSAGGTFQANCPLCLINTGHQLTVHQYTELLPDVTPIPYTSSMQCGVRVTRIK